MSEKRDKVILVYCSDDEKATIENEAKEKGLSASSYLRNLGLCLDALPQEIIELLKKLGESSGEHNINIEAGRKDTQESGAAIDIRKVG